MEMAGGEGGDDGNDDGGTDDGGTTMTRGRFSVTLDDDEGTVLCHLETDKNSVAIGWCQGDGVRGTVLCHLSYFLK